MLIDKTDGKLIEAIKFSRTIKDSSLIKCLKRLRNIHRNNPYYHEGATYIYSDGAKLSFYFERYTKENIFRGNGGIIFHGSHDGFGSGSAPTFSVCINPTNGWSVHT